MNYYERHLGDYAKDTAHLNMLEHGAYTLLLDRYYATEAPIPADQVHRVARARTTEEREAVDAVLAEFFDLQDGEWHHGKCDQLIGAFLESQPERDAKRENDRERKRKYRERRSALFSQLAEHGVVPPFNTSTSELESKLSRVLSRGTGHGTGRGQVVGLDVGLDVGRDGDGTATQTPNTNPQSPVKDQELKAPAAPADFKADLFSRWKALPGAGGAAFLVKLLKDHKPEQRVLEAVERTLEETRADPKAFVLGVLRKEAKAEDDYDLLMARVR